MNHLTTSEAARLANVHAKMIIKWCNEGLLDHWKLPGSSHRRIDPYKLAEFLKKYDNPVPNELHEMTRGR